MTFLYISFKSKTVQLQSKRLNKVQSQNKSVTKNNYKNKESLHGKEIIKS